MRGFLTISFIVCRRKVIHSYVVFHGDRRRAAKTVSYCADGRTWPDMNLDFGYVESDVRRVELLAHSPAFPSVTTTTTTSTTTNTATTITTNTATNNTITTNTATAVTITATTANTATTITTNTATNNTITTNTTTTTTTATTLCGGE